MIFQGPSMPQGTVLPVVATEYRWCVQFASECSEWNLYPGDHSKDEEHCESMMSFWKEMEGFICLLVVSLEVTLLETIEAESQSVP